MIIKDISVENGDNVKIITTDRRFFSATIKNNKIVSKSRIIDIDDILKIEKEIVVPENNVQCKSCRINRR